MRPTLLYRVYTALTAVVLPFAARARVRRLRRAEVPTHRAHEILGHASAERPGGRLIWVHAASVGESLSVLPLIEAMGRADPAQHFLITSATPTSAALIAARAPGGCIHQYAPLDAGGPLRRFLSRWRPDAAIFVESELWPQMLVQTRARGVPIALVGARLSATSLRRWAKAADTARFILGQFDLILAQNAAMAEALRALAPDTTAVETGFNLKSLSPPLPVEPAALAHMQRSTKARPVWVAASTHPGEEAEALAAHAQVLRQHPDALLILAPRHPERGDEVAEVIAAQGLTFTRRSAGDAPDAQVFLADTLGEMGLWYALARFVFLGGSLRPHGGHNPFEVAHAGAALMTGPHIANFSESFAPLEAAGAVKLVSDADDLARQALVWLDHPDTLDKARAAARGFVADRSAEADGIAQRLIDVLKIEVG